LISPSKTYFSGLDEVMKVYMQDNSEKMTVETYPWINKNDPDIGGEWDFEVR